MTKHLLIAAAVTLALAGCGRDEDSAANRSGTDVTPSGTAATTPPVTTNPGPMQTGEASYPGPAAGSGTTPMAGGDASNNAMGTGSSGTATGSGTVSSSTTGSGGTGATTPTAPGNLSTNSARP